MKPVPDSIRTIRRRFQLLLLRAFGIVVLLTIILMLGAVFLFSNLPNQRNPFYPSPIAFILDRYYREHRSWNGVQAQLPEEADNPDHPPHPSSINWNRTLLLDVNGRVVLNHGRADSPLVGTLYTSRLGEFNTDLIVDEQRVGTLVLEPGAMSHPWRLVSSLLVPIGVISLLLGVLTLLIGLLLTQRVVSPLSEIIATAQQVADGKLSARVEVHGPQDDLRALSDHFNHMAASLERSDRERRNLLADITHELRTPLTILRGRLEGILDGVYQANDAHIAPALEEAYLLERLVDDLQLLTQAETHQLHFEPRRLNLGDLASKVVSLFKAQADEKGVALTVEAQPDLADISADPQRLEQVIGNLIGNALRYTPQGGNIKVEVKRTPEGEELAVTDDGPGVPENELPSIFDRFWRSEKSRARATGGAGLGLAIARQLIEAQGGSIMARTMPEKGLRVWFILPVASIPANGS
jgi:two-component system OmpR family sensor kinase/two-component system sensor histidine kinase BaeS